MLYNQLYYIYAVIVVHLHYHFVFILNLEVDIKILGTYYNCSITYKRYNTKPKSSMRPYIIKYDNIKKKLLCTQVILFFFYDYTIQFSIFLDNILDYFSLYFYKNKIKKIYLLINFTIYSLNLYYNNYYFLNSLSRVSDMPFYETIPYVHIV